MDNFAVIAARIALGKYEGEIKKDESVGTTSTTGRMENSFRKRRRLLDKPQSQGGSTTRYNNSIKRIFSSSSTTDGGNDSDSVLHCSTFNGKDARQLGPETIQRMIHDAQSRRRVDGAAALATIYSQDEDKVSKNENEGESLVAKFERMDLHNPLGKWWKVHEDTGGKHRRETTEQDGEEESEYEYVYESEIEIIVS